MRSHTNESKHINEKLLSPKVKVDDITHKKSLNEGNFTMLLMT